jgi:iron complex transport system permease protein
LLGSASGASFGVAIALALFGGNPFATEFLIRLGLTGAAFIGAVLAVMLTIALAQGVQHTLRLLLAGVIVGVVLGAMASLISLLRPDVLQGMQGFLLGSTSFIGWNSCALMFGVLLVCMGLAFFLSRVLDALSLGELTALSLGMPLAKARLVLVTLLALATGAAVAQTGLVAFVGLAAPHLVRSLIKTKYNWVILLSTLMGGLLLLLADLLARLLLSPQELPVGVLTAVLGGGYLLWLMYQSQKKAAVG